MNIVFIAGCARSGTSIFGELFRAHPNVMYVYEEKIWRLAEKDSHKVSADEISSKKRSKIRKWLKIYKRKGKAIIEKNPRHIVRLPFVKSVFPEAKIIHIVRDGRDVSCSLKTGLCGKTWAHVKPPRWKEIESNYQGAIRCAHAWKDIMEIAIKDLENIEHLQVKYEDLVSDPVSVISNALNYIGLSLHPKVKDFANDKVQNSLAGSYVASNQLRWYTRDHSIRVGRWKENMTEEEQEKVLEIILPVLKYYGYE